MTGTKTYVVKYDSNNSGGGWWLDDDDWKALEDAGWRVEWFGRSFCHCEYGNFGRHRPPNTCADANSCPGHRGAENYEQAVAMGKDARWLRAIATTASIEVEAYSSELAEGVAELRWGEALPNEDAKAEGCDCCGRPHSFYAREKKA